MVKYITYWRVAFILGLLAVFFNMTLTDWGSWAAIITCGIAVLIGGVALRNYLLNKYRRHKLFIPYQVLNQFHASSAMQRVEYEIKMQHNTYVEFIVIGFSGNGTIPEIQNLSDYQGKEKGNLVVYQLENQKQPGEWWFWGYKTPRHRFKGALITMAIEFLATAPFDGILEFQMTANDTSKVSRLPFKVMQKFEEDDK